MKILVIAPHMDDEILGVGGSLRKHVLSGDIVNVCIIANRIYKHSFDIKNYEKEKQCTYKAKDIIGYHDVKFLDLNDERLDICIQDIIIPLEDYFFKCLPDIIYINFWEDNNQDHRAVFNAARVIIRRTSNYPPKKVLVYETPSSTEQAPPYHFSFTPNYYVNIEKEMDTKISAVDCYDKEKREYPHPRSMMAIKNLARRRGIESGFNFAEAFMIIYDQWK